MINVMFTNRNRIREAPIGEKTILVRQKEAQISKKQPGTECIRLLMADRVGFEPTDADASLVLRPVP